MRDLRRFLGLWFFLWWTAGCAAGLPFAREEPLPATLPPPPARPSPSPTPPPSPSPTPSPHPTASPTWSPSPAPTRTPTDTTMVTVAASLTRRVRVATQVWEVLYASPHGARLQHRAIPGCEVIFAQPAQWPTSAVHHARVAGYPVQFYRGKAEDGRWWVLYQGWGDVVVRVLAPASRFPACDAAFATLMTSLHLNDDAARACVAQDALPLRVGARVRSLTHVYLRSEPRWAEATRRATLPPNYPMTITGPPTCAPYPKGLYVYWPVRLDDGREGWVAQGDTEALFIEAIMP